MVTDELRELLDLAKTRRLAFDEIAQLISMLKPMELELEKETDGSELLGLKRIFYQHISEHTQLRKRGDMYIGLCPFHKEETPSFAVSFKTKRYHCFGCGVDGGFAELMKNLGFY